MGTIAWNKDRALGFDGEPTERCNGDRAETAEAGVKASLYYRGECQNIDTEAISDFLTDLMHLCDREGITDIDGLFRCARGNWEAERGRRVESVPLEMLINKAMRSVMDLVYPLVKVLAGLVADGECYCCPEGNADKSPCAHCVAKVMLHKITKPRLMTALRKIWNAIALFLAALADDQEQTTDSPVEFTGRKM